MENDGGIDYLNNTFGGLPGYIYIAMISGIILCCITTIILFCCLRKQKKKDIQNSTTLHDNDIEMEHTKNGDENDDILRVNSMSFDHDTMTTTPMTPNGMETPSDFIGVSANDIATTLPLPSASPIDNMMPIQSVTPNGVNDMLPPNVIPNVVTDFGPFNIKQQTGNNIDGNGEESEDEDDNEFNDMYNHQMTADHVETSGM